MMRPFRLRIIILPASCEHHQTPERLQSITSRHCCGFIRIASASRVMPPLLTTSEIGVSPNDVEASLKSCTTASCCETSAWIATASPPAALICATTSFAGPSDET